MKTFSGAALVAAVLLLPALPASATPQPTTGPTCGMVLNADLTAEGRVYSGPVYAGPIVVVDPSTNTPATGTVRCTVQVNAPLHAGTDAASATGPTGTGAVALPQTLVSIVATPGDTVYLCTQVDLLAAPAYYWDGTAWSTNPLSPCVTAGYNPPPDAYYV